MRWIGSMAGLALAVLAGPLAAQGPGGGRMMGPTLEELTSALALDETQQAKVKELLDRYQVDIKAPRETMMENMRMVREGTVTRESVQEENQVAMGKIREASDSLNAGIKALLNPEQQKAFDAFLEQRRAQRPGGNRPPPMP